MKDQGQISNEVATFWITPNITTVDNITTWDYTNNVAFGGIPNDLNKQSYHEFKADTGFLDSGLWVTGLDWIKLGKTQIQKAPNSYAFIDNSSPNILLPQDLWDGYFWPMANNTVGLTCNSYSCFNNTATCDQISDIDNMQSLIFKLGLNEYTITPRAYAFSHDSMCTLGVSYTQFTN
jgi:hypothetical protein